MTKDDTGTLQQVMTVFATLKSLKKEDSIQWGYIVAGNSIRGQILPP